MKTPNKRIKSKFHHRGTYTKIGKVNKPKTKGAFGKKKKIEAWEMPDEDYKEAIRGYWRF